MVDDDDEFLSEVADTVERQLNHQQQLGGALDATEPGRFDFALNPYVNRRSARMGVHERYYTANLRQVCQFIPSQNLAVAFRDPSSRTKSHTAVPHFGSAPCLLQSSIKSSH